MRMKKTRKDAKWAGLSPEARNKLEKWLFEECMGFEEALKEAQRQFNFQGSISSLKRFYQRASEARMLTDAVNEAAGARPSLSEGEARTVAMKAVGNLLVRQITENPEDIKEWWVLAKLMLQSQENELRERLHREETELRERLHREKSGIRREHLELARERFQWNAVDDAEKALPEIQELVRKRQDPKARTFDFNKAMNAVRLKLFGRVPGPAPEDAEHEAEMADFEAQKDRLKPDEFGRYCMEKVRGMLAKGLTWVDICRRVDANVVTAAKWAEEGLKREDGGLRMENGGKTEQHSDECGTRSAQYGIGEPGNSTDEGVSREDAKARRADEAQTEINDASAVAIETTREPDEADESSDKTDEKSP